MILTIKEIQKLKDLLFTEVTKEQTDICFQCDGNSEIECNNKSICNRYFPVEFDIDDNNDETSKLVKDLLETINYYIERK
jgi:hypothetical protein